MSTGTADTTLSDGDFERVRRMIKERAGINLQPSKHSMVQGRLARLLREHRFADFRTLLDAVEQPRSALWQPFVNALTTNLTSFFRESYHFPLLAEFLRAQRGPVRIWCAAASTGEEPWSIAITALETLSESVPLTILATDIDTDVLDTARSGVYPLDGEKGLDKARLKRWFLRGTGRNAGLIRVRPELARRVEFGQFNLVRDPVAFAQPFDVVFCRNVMIYFDAATQRSVLTRLHQSMRPGGMLFVGHSENFSSQTDLFVLRGKTVYERLAERTVREPVDA